MMREVRALRDCFFAALVAAGTTLLLLILAKCPIGKPRDLLTHSLLIPKTMNQVGRIAKRYPALEQGTNYHVF